MQASQTQSRITDNSDNLNNSKILSRKQIEKRMQVLKVPQMQKVITNLNHQNQRLKKQVKDLHQKVEELIIAKKIPQPKNDNPQIEQELKKAKKQLNQRYEEMSSLKAQLNESRNSQNGTYGQEIKNQLKEYYNKIHSTEQQIQKLQKQHDEIVQIYQANCQAMQQFIPSAESRSQNEEKISKMKEENKELKKKIQDISQQSKLNDKDSQAILGKFYNLKNEEQKFLKAFKGAKSKMTMQQVKNVDLTQVSSLEQEIQILRRKKKETEKQLINEKMQKDHRKSVLERNAKQLMEVHKDILHRRMKAYSRLNLYEAKDQQHRQLKEIKEAQKSVKLEDRASQTDKIVPKDFRKQFIGKSQGLAFDDSLILDYRSQISIKGVLVYKTIDYIVFTKFFYETALRRRYQTKIPFEQSTLRKFETKRYNAPAGECLKSFKVALTNDIITKIQLIWSNGESVSEGWQIDGSTKYKADIGPEQRPSSMFGSVSPQGKNLYALESLGCEVNIIQNEQF